MTRTNVLLSALILILFGIGPLKAETAEIDLPNSVEEALIENAAKCMAALEVNTVYGIVPKNHSSVRRVDDVVLEVVDVVFDGNREALQYDPLFAFRMEDHRVFFENMGATIGKIYIQQELTSCVQTHNYWMYSLTGNNCYIIRGQC